MKNEDVIRELIYKSWHRGCKETDILLGFFAKDCVEKMNEKTLEVYKEFIAEPDWDIYAWLTNGAKCPQQYDQIVENIVEYHANKKI
jgi:antitoxin CptB